MNGGVFLHIYIERAVEGVGSLCALGAKRDAEQNALGDGDGIRRTDSLKQLRRKNKESTERCAGAKAKSRLKQEESPLLSQNMRMKRMKGRKNKKIQKLSKKMKKGVDRRRMVWYYN